MSGPLPGWLAPVSIPASWLYGIGVRLRNARLDRPGMQKRLSRPVISVGNITAGGTGKSPMVAWLCEQLGDAGVEPVIGMRGYGERAGERSDEALEYAERIGSVPVVADPDRHTALQAFLCEHESVDCVVMDDGFQHRMVHRDFDIVLVDGSRGLHAARLLPAGWLREPLDGLRRANAVVVTKVDGPDQALAAVIERYHGRKPMAWCTHAWDGVDVFEAGGRHRVAATDWLSGKNVVTMFGVGNPCEVLGHVRRAGACVIENVPVRDHEAYTGDQVSRIGRRAGACEGLVTTAKDWVKIREVLDWSDWTKPVIVPRLRLEFVSGEQELLEAVLKTVKLELTK